MMPMVPNLALDVGSQALGLGWTVGGVMSFAIIGLFAVSAGLLVFAAIGGLLGVFSVRVETASPRAPREAIVGARPQPGEAARAA
jgi:hypothetical protein